jgi:23S rRNA (pseudouridine1915-N3)-methyltransferase
MNIQVLCVGTLKEKYWRDASEEYEKRLKRYCSLRIEEVKEIKSDAVDATKNGEGALLLNRIKKETYAIALDINGKTFTSEEFADMLAQNSLHGKSQICFIIGGSHGLSNEVLEKADIRMSISSFTCPHQRRRIVLLEQLYRGFKINSNETYHK